MTLTEHVDEIFETTRALYRAEEWGKLNAAMVADVVLAGDNPTILITWLTATLPCKSRLFSRSAVYANVRHLLGENADKVLKGLE
jgi:hypothetical protein